ncbi:MAG: LytTR family transcriptional regulator [Caulobacterales bacterium]|nr:LytTR family transcriptional regulator [Caulobacterales bacterium]
MAENASTSTSRRDGLFIAAAAAFGVAIVVVDTFSVTHDRAEAGRPIATWEPLTWETTSVVVMLALLPLVMALTRRAPPRLAAWRRTAVVHVLGAIAFSLTHVTAMGLLRWAVYAGLGAHYSPVGPLSEFPYELRKDLLAYLGLVAGYCAWMRLQPAPAPHPEPLEALEVREGARRRFVPLSEVAWLEAAGNYVELHRAAGPILHRASLSEMERRLRDHGYVRIHRSRLVRQAAIAQVDSKPSGDFTVRLADGRELAGSRRYRRPLLEP